MDGALLIVLGVFVILVGVILKDMKDHGWK